MITGIRTLQEFPRNIPLFIFGAGACGQEVRQALRRGPGVIVGGFIDNYKRGEQDGLKIVSLEEFLECKPAEFKIVVASQYNYQIYAQLLKQEIKDFYDAYPFYEATRDAKAVRKAKLIAGAVVALIAAGVWWLAR